MPKEGKAKGGTPASRVGAWLQKINAKEGPEIKFTGKCDRYPNTEKYHVALAYVLEVHGAAAQTRCSARVFKGYYQDGIYPDEKNLISQVGEVVTDLDPAALQAALRSESKHARVLANARKLRDDYQVRGVPYFIVNDKFAVSGAQETDYFLRLFAEA